MSKFKVGDRIRRIEKGVIGYTPMLGHEATVIISEKGRPACIAWEGETAYPISDKCWELIPEEKAPIMKTSEAVTKFEVGKTYIKTGVTKYTCIFANDDVALFKWVEERGEEGHTYFRQDWAREYKEYVKPIEHVRYFNVYTGVVSEYRTRKEADDGASKMRIACKRVVFKEGEFDE